MTFTSRARVLMDLCVLRRKAFDVVSGAYTARVRQHLEKFICLSQDGLSGLLSVNCGECVVRLKTLSVSMMDVFHSPQILWKRLMEAFA